VAGEDFIDQGPEPHDLATQFQSRYLKRQDGVIGGFYRRLTYRNRDGRDW
jgi:hypothetical protein